MIIVKPLRILWTKLRLSTSLCSLLLMKFSNWQRRQPLPTWWILPLNYNQLFQMKSKYWLTSLLLIMTWRQCTKFGQPRTQGWTPMVTSPTNYFSILLSFIWTSRAWLHLDPLTDKFNSMQLIELRPYIPSMTPSSPHILKMPLHGENVLLAMSNAGKVPMINVHKLVV